MEVDFRDCALSKMLGIEFPLIVAPMFLVSNDRMVIEAIKAGATAAIPALNYRTTEELREAIRKIKLEVKGPFGINIIVSKSNPKSDDQLKVCCEEKVDFIITSLGSPEKVINEAHNNGILVFCDVVNEQYARKVEKLGADAVIAVNKEAGGHSGNISYKELVPMLKKVCSIPVISAGGVGNGAEMRSMIGLGADGCSVGSIFIATEEADVSQEYKQACVDYGKKDIVHSTKLSGVPCTVINTPYVQEIGTKQTWLERFLYKNKRLRKWVRMLVYARGQRLLKKSALGASYKTVWCAGPSIEHVKSIRKIGEIIAQLKREYEEK